MKKWLSVIAGTVVLVTKSSTELDIENLSLHQQIAVFKDKQPKPRLSISERAFWIWIFLSRIYRDWKRHLLIVKPQTVVDWHRQRFQLYWKWISRKKNREERPKTCKEIRILIRRMAFENDWGRQEFISNCSSFGLMLMTGLSRATCRNAR